MPKAALAGRSLPRVPELPVSSCLLGLHWGGASPTSPCASIPSGAPEEGPRVVFMVDLWHPNVAAAERQALDFIFAPGR